MANNRAILIIRKWKLQVDYIENNQVNILQDINYSQAKIGIKKIYFQFRPIIKIRWPSPNQIKMIVRGKYKIFN